MHVYKHLNINSKITPLKLRKIKRMEKHCIHKDDSVWTYWVRLHAHSIPHNVFISMHRQIISEIWIDSLVYMDKTECRPRNSLQASKPASVDIKNMSTSVFTFVISGYELSLTIVNQTWIPSNDEILLFHYPSSAHLLLTWWDSITSAQVDLNTLHWPQFRLWKGHSHNWAVILQS